MEEILEKIGEYEKALSESKDKNKIERNQNQQLNAVNKELEKVINNLENQLQETHQTNSALIEEINEQWKEKEIKMNEDRIILKERFEKKIEYLDKQLRKKDEQINNQRELSDQLQIMNSNMNIEIKKLKKGSVDRSEYERKVAECEQYMKEKENLTNSLSLKINSLRENEKLVLSLQQKHKEFFKKRYSGC